MKKDRAGKARQVMEDRKMNCAQAVFHVFSGEFGLEPGLALSIAQGFGGGMGHSGGTCGAVTGAYMALGLAHKITPGKPRTGSENVYTLMGEFNRQFKTLHNSLNCTDLTGYDLSLPEKAEEARQKNVFATVCPGLVADAVRIVESLLKLK